MPTPQNSPSTALNPSVRSTQTTPTTTEGLKAPPAECPLEEVLDFLSGAWTTQILWYLQEGPLRFGELKRNLKGVSAKVLTVRLRELEGRGVISRKVLPTSPPMVEYTLTDLGHQFQPIFQKIADVGRLLQRNAAKT